MVLTASNCNNWLQTPNYKLTELPVAPGYIIVHFLFDSSAGVGGQYITQEEKLQILHFHYKEQLLNKHGTIN